MNENDDNAAHNLRLRSLELALQVRTALTTMHGTAPNPDDVIKTADKFYKFLNFDNEDEK